MSKRRALIVGFNNYPGARLEACEEDARALRTLLSHHEGPRPEVLGPPNFDCVSPNLRRRVQPSELREHLEALFLPDDNLEVALFYFAGHGSRNTLGGYLELPGSTHDTGFPMNDVVSYANLSPARHRIVILDCCFSGYAGELQGAVGLSSGVTVVTASLRHQPSYERLRESGSYESVCSALLIDGLRGAAKDVLGSVRLSGLFNHLQLSPFTTRQQPCFRSNMAEDCCLRECVPAVPREVLLNLPKHFPTPDSELQLDPSYDPELEPLGHRNEAVMADLRALIKAGMLEVADGRHLFHAAQQHGSCRLTPKARAYWELAKQDQL